MLAHGETRWSTLLSSTKPNSEVVAALARSFVAGEQTTELVAQRGGKTLGRQWRWLGPLAKRYVKKYEGRTRPRQREVVQFLLKDKGFRRVWEKHFKKLGIADRFVGSVEMQPVAKAKGWRVPAIESVPELADWLRLTVSEAEWFADLKGLGRRNQDGLKLQQYSYRIVTKRTGSVRLIESPKPRLKELQRQILMGILDRVPAHAAVHGFVRGRSIKTFTEPHAGQRVVLRMDMQDFFPSIRGARVQALFRTMGYPETVADMLGGICTNATPRWVWRRRAGEFRGVRELYELYRVRHLPQGAPASPALGNMCAYRLDCRLAGLAEAAGARYTRYADDLAFSGGEEFERGVERFSVHVGAVLEEEGFVANHRKTRVMRQGVRQHLAGLVVNQHVGLKREDFDRLKALLTNCARKGPQSQNLEGRASLREHLAGRVGFVEMIQPVRGRRLRELFERIDWSR